MTDNPTPTPPKPKKKRKPRKLDPNRTLLKDMTYEERQAYKKKTCSVCKKTKNKTQFNKDRRSKDGKHHMCKLCNRQNKAWWLYGKPEEEKPMSKNGLPLHVDDLRAMGKDVVALIKQLPPAKAEELKYNWRFWARENQIAPEGDWNNCLFLAGRGAGKLICQNTDILTKNKGWVKLKDIEVGDYVYDEAGKPTKVLKTFDALPQKAYRLTFSDGTQVDACDEHQWTTWTHRDRKAFGRSVYETTPVAEDWPNWVPKKRYGQSKVVNVDNNFVDTRVKTTQDIVDTFYQGKRRDLNHSIPLAKPIEMEEKELLVDPYVFGYWLGDGYKFGSVFTCDPKDQDNLIEQLTSAGYDIGTNKCEKTVSALGLITQIKAIGAYDKVIPEDYVYCSKEQRLAVLRGLMDSDGYVDNSKVEFTAKRKEHAEYVMYLARSLGQKPTLSEGRAMLNGVDYGTKYRVTWRPAQGINPFLLPRKAKKVSFGGSQESRNHHRMITSFEETQRKPMRCLTVDSPNSLFLITKALIPTHNTRAGAEWVREKVKEGHKRILCVAATNSDIERVMVKGESGLLNVCWKHDKTHRGAEMGYPIWSPTKRTLTWENGAQVLFFSAEEPERLRGPQGSASWCDESCAWTKDRETWDMLQFCLRLGKHPQVFITTTPKPTKLLRDIIKNPKTTTITGSTYDNAANLAKTYLEAVKNQYEGTRLGRQELHAEILDEASGSLWTREILSTCEIDRESIPDLVRVIVSVDPAVTSKEDSDETGIIVAGIDRDGISYILEDHSGTYTPEGWASKAVELYEVLEADCIVAEVNQGGDMVRHTIHTVDPDVPVRMVRASRGKALRAEPVASLYERGKVKHVKGLDKLEDQMVQWEPLGRHSSPDRLDAAVQAVVNLALKNVTLPSLNLGYQSAKGLLSR
jgi:phage terminase large subunit-like protein